jgi:hypothetical protein
MLGKDLSEALSGIADDKIEAAAQVAPESHRPLWVRAAACAAVLAILIGAVLFWPGTLTGDGGQIIAVPGVLKVYACDLEATPENEVQEHIFSEDVFLWRAVWAASIQDGDETTPHFGRPITFEMPKDYYGSAEITFEISSTTEGFCKKTVLKNGEAFYLTKQVDVRTKIRLMQEMGDKDLFLHVLIYADGRIVGYAVMNFYMHPDGYCYAYKCATVCFPMINGECQDVSEEYVWQRMDEYKSTQPDNQGAEFFKKLHENV